MDEKWSEQDLQNQDIEFIKEKVKERPLNRRKLLRRTIITASMAVIFGLIACVTFLVLEPVFSNLLYPEEEPQQVELKEEDIHEEMNPEDMILEAETETQEPAPQPQTVVEKVELEMSDYQRLYRTMYGLVQQMQRSLVTVTGVSSDTDWFDNLYESAGQAAGLVLADNGKELLILTDAAAVEEAESLQVTFSDSEKADARQMGIDRETGLAVISVELEKIPQTVRANIRKATLGSSGASILATPVIAVGRPLGTAPSVIYGMVTSTDTPLNLADANVHVLTTDMVNSDNASGVLINLSGQVVGILRPAVMQEADHENLLTAYGITDLRRRIERLSNGKEIAHLGIRGTDVPEEIVEKLGVPSGAYVTEIQMDSPAMTAGIQSGDVIVQLGTETITSFADYQSVLLNQDPDTSMSMKVMRQGVEEYQEMTVDVILGR